MAAPATATPKATGLRALERRLRERGPADRVTPGAGSGWSGTAGHGIIADTACPGDTGPERCGPEVFGRGDARRDDARRDGSEPDGSEPDDAGPGGTAGPPNATGTRVRAELPNAGGTRGESPNTA
ncbi:MAG TPA: hypothetical protein VGJ13_01965, partial [Pseudonocardiaceae bacterium]